jgi:hypothetical protein
MIQSEEFPPYDLQKEFWTLRLYPKGHQRLSKEQPNQASTGGASTTDDDSTVQFYLTLCPSHVASQHPSNTGASASNGAGSNNPNHIASSLMNTSSRQLQVYFRALINFSNPQVEIKTKFFSKIKFPLFHRVEYFIRKLFMIVVVI